ncbi:MAG: hypothetical protein LAO31_19335 [Acidobacteriia bacterium]|nr:hypothetical protein [Terriglobia bacterium]
MNDHMSLGMVLILNYAIGWFKTYSEFYHDWCGIRLLPRVLALQLPSMIIIVAIYVDIIHFAQITFLRHYFFLISLVAAQAADLITRHLLRSQSHGRSSKVNTNYTFAVSVQTAIAMKKIQIVDCLSQRPNPRDILIDALKASGISPRKVDPLICKINTPPTREQMFDVVNTLGVAMAKTLVKSCK